MKREEIDQQMTSQKPTEHSTSASPAAKRGTMNRRAKLFSIGLIASAVPLIGMSSAEATDERPLQGAAVSSTAAPTVAAVDQANYSVSFERIANDLDGNARYRVTTTGFAAGNWANLWVKSHDATQPGGQQDFGGALTNSAGNAIITASKEMPAGDHAIQVSVGAYPNEQWSQPLEIKKSTQFTSVPTTISRTGSKVTISGKSEAHTAGSSVVVFANPSLTGVYTVPKPTVAHHTTTAPDGSWSIELDVPAIVAAHKSHFGVAIDPAAAYLELIAVTTSHTTGGDVTSYSFQGGNPTVTARWT